MSFVGTGKLIVFGVLAASVSLAAMQLASGHEVVPGLTRASPSAANPAAANADNINRAAKSDRAALVATTAPTRTVSVRLLEFEDTSFLLRLPTASTPKDATTGESRGPASGPKLLIETEGGKAEDAKRPVACEPSVSVLTEIARRMQPGRCVT